MLPITRGQQIIHALEQIPKQIEAILAQNKMSNASRRNTRRRRIFSFWDGNTIFRWRSKGR